MGDLKSEMLEQNSPQNALVDLFTVIEVYLMSRRTFFYSVNRCNRYYSCTQRRVNRLCRIELSFDCMNDLCLCQCW